MAQLNGRLPLSYRAYRYPHRRGRLTRRWRAPARIASAASVGLGVLLAVAAFTTVLGISSVAYVAGALPNVKELKSAPLALSTFIYDRSGTQLLYTLEEERRELVKLDEVPKVMAGGHPPLERRRRSSRRPGVRRARPVPVAERVPLRIARSLRQPAAERRQSAAAGAADADATARADAQAPLTASR